VQIIEPPTNIADAEIQARDKPNLAYVARVALVASTGGFLFGYDMALMAGALPFLEREFALTPALAGWAVSSAILGGIAGPLLGLWFTDAIGRRRTMMLSAFIFMASTIGCALAGSIHAFAFWRFVGGMGVGLAMISSPIYIAELAPPAVRGSLVNVNQLSNVIGINLAVVVAYLFSGYDENWRLMLGSQAIPVMFLMFGLLLVPESPRWLAGKGRTDEAMKVLTRINGPTIARQELAAINADVGSGKGQFVELWAPSSRTALKVGIILMIFSQVNGVNMLLLYAPTIMTEAGISFGSNAILSSVPIYLLILICTLFAFPLIHRFSRRGLLMASAAGIAAGHILMAVILALHLPAMLLLIPMMIGTGAFTVGLAPLSWVIVSEIFPNRIRGKAIAVVCVFLFAASFLTAQSFPIIVDWFKKTTGSSAGVYLIFAAVCISCVWFAWRKLPETKGLSLEEIGAFWRERQKSDQGL
jgi:sugar porter (SP) family MFS transporter